MKKKLSDEIYEIFHAERYKRVPTDNICLYGAGTLGKKLTEILVGSGTPPLCLVDTCVNKCGTSVHGISVLTPEKAAERFGGTATFVVTAFNRSIESDFTSIALFLTSLGVKNIVPYPLLALNYADILLPHFAQDVPTCLDEDYDSILKAGKLFSDPMSHCFFLDMLKVSTTANYRDFSSPVVGDGQYFSPEVMRRVKKIHMVDCGAYNGDTLKDFLDIYGGERLGSWYAFEPDPGNFAQLTSFVENLPNDVSEKIFLYNCATGNCDSHVDFFSNQGEGSYIGFCEQSSNSKNVVKILSRPIDAVLQDAEVNFIKMDVEGFESETLAGSEKIIRKQKPILAVCVYHKPKDFFQLPLMVKSFFDGEENMKYLLRRVCSYFYDTVFFAIRQ